MPHKAIVYRSARTDARFSTDVSVHYRRQRQNDDLLATWHYVHAYHASRPAQDVRRPPFLAHHRAHDVLSPSFTHMSAPQPAFSRAGGARSRRQYAPRPGPHPRTPPVAYSFDRRGALFLARAGEADRSLRSGIFSSRNKAGAVQAMPAPRSQTILGLGYGLGRVVSTRATVA
ncbi:hypothetical protein WOLCODRAFT_167300 [Wolfiporia cocos MD-104 SS10]|uniref:Uncharacterized protein n=1 Tax=Wolfiporia cocos (strain MD-104) TaxID=742152 RepID=A0A2H3JKB4_WOLCO|nr:hypothetical protein WOLCODRAFT_167300 [Wolfiporia cocos MD-104 SS10]